MPSKIALVTPYYYPSVRGNSITVQRIESGLKDHGLSVEVFSLDRTPDPAAIQRGLEAMRPDVIHGFHAFVAGHIVVEATERLGVPAILTLTGTDANHDLFDAARRSVVVDALRRAQAIVVFHAAIGARVAREIPAVQGKIRVIGQTVQCDEAAYDLRAKLGLRREDVVFFLPAGIRKVKDVTYALGPLEGLRRRFPAIKFVVAGPVIEPEEGERLKTSLGGRPWAFYIGALSHEELCAALKGVDIVLNSSLSEGGMSNVILEAMSKGVAVLARDIEGNRTVVRDGVDGFLFGSEAEFLEKAGLLAADPVRRRSLGAAGRERIEQEFPLEGEIGEYLELYRAVRSAGRG